MGVDEKSCPRLEYNFKSQLGIRGATINLDAGSPALGKRRPTSCVVDSKSIAGSIVLGVWRRKVRRTSTRHSEMINGEVRKYGTENHLQN